MRPDIRIHLTSNQDEHEGVRRLLRKEMDQHWRLPALPATPDGAWSGGKLVGQWRDHRLVGGAFIGPPQREADELIEGRPAEQSAYEWMTTRLVIVHYIHTKKHYRRQGIARATLEFIEGLAVEHGDDYILAVPTTPIARQLDTQAGYCIRPTGVGVALLRQSGEPFGLFPAGPEDTYAVRKLRDGDMFSIREDG